jgi:hypothetical protein
MLQFLAQRTNKHSVVEAKILQTNPVLEAFGNAATVRNYNSSRFVLTSSSHSSPGLQFPSSLLDSALLVGCPVGRVNSWRSTSPMTALRSWAQDYRTVPMLFSSLTYNR